MLVDIPGTTQELFTELQKRVSRLPEEDRNAFVIDLLKFTTDWQFAYLSFINQRSLEEEHSKKDGKGSF